MQTLSSPCPSTPPSVLSAQDPASLVWSQILEAQHPLRPHLPTDWEKRKPTMQDRQVVAPLSRE